MLKFLYKANTNQNNELVSVINSGLKDLKEEIKEMSEEEIKIEKPDKIIKIAEEIVRFNKQKQEGKGIKILTPNQMLSRLPITLAQLKAGNDSEKLKNEIRQLLYSLCRSKNMTKQVYNNLIMPIWIKNIIIIIFLLWLLSSLSSLSLSLLLLLLLKTYIIKHGDIFYEYWK